MLPGFDIRSNVREFKRSLNRVEREQLPFAVFRAVNDVAQGGVTHNQRAMRRALDRPKPFTIRGIYARKARYRRGSRNAGLAAAVSTASLMWREFAGKGTAAGQYLRPQVFGTPRLVKRHEAAMRRRGLIGRSSFLVPAPGQRLNQYGNLPRTTYVRILSGLGASSDATQNRTSRSRTRNTRRRDFFVPKKGGALAPGVWERKRNGSIKPVLIEVRQPQYRRRFDFFGTSQAFVRRQFPISLRLAMRQAMRTAR